MLFNRRNCGRPSCGCDCGCNMPNPCDPVMEPSVTNCVEKDFCCEVNHIVPVHTHTINKVHVMHNYTPQFSCSEETQVIDSGCGNNMAGNQAWNMPRNNACGSTSCSNSDANFPTF